ncbi:hypothetical protein KIL84_009359 [Mauremys mutica]|uniref:Uncharacterized protein n=1 Tax=Mauremys mutica TaxID=74926 RepID=A0A9D4B3W8_9SAUR|nr:hypothetical protein KIL84_009359 [Mauremys mutica]
MILAGWKPMLGHKSKLYCYKIILETTWESQCGECLVRDTQKSHRNKTNISQPMAAPDKGTGYIRRLAEEGRHGVDLAYRLAVVNAASREFETSGQTKNYTGCENIFL